MFSRFGSPDHSFIILPYMAGQTVSVGGQKEKNLIRLKKRFDWTKAKAGAAPQKRPKTLRIALRVRGKHPHPAPVPSGSIRRAHTGSSVRPKTRRRVFPTFTQAPALF